jgi:hypothetical protein
MFSPRSRSLTDWPSQRGFMCAPMPMWSSADIRRYSGISWARNPISARKAGDWRGALPRIAASPLVGLASPDSSRSSVVLTTPRLRSINRVGR